jgi:hypothetical protein
VDNEVLRHKLMTRIDALLGRTLLVRGEDRALLSGVRGYVAVMTDAELTKLAGYMARRDGEESPQPEEESD